MPVGAVVAGESNDGARHLSDQGNSSLEHALREVVWIKDRIEKANQ